MIEGGGKEVKEADLMAAMKLAHGECVKLIDAQLELRAALGSVPRTLRVSWRRLR